MHYSNQDYLYYAYLSLYPVGNDEASVKEKLEHYQQVLDPEKLKKVIELVNVGKEFFILSDKLGFSREDTSKLSDIIRTVLMQKVENPDIEKDSRGKSL